MNFLKNCVLLSCNKLFFKVESLLVRSSGLAVFNSTLVGDSDVNMALQGELGWKLNTTHLLCKSTFIVYLLKHKAVYPSVQITSIISSLPQSKSFARK